MNEVGRILDFSYHSPFVGPVFRMNIGMRFR